MQVNNIKRPWTKDTEKYGNRLKRDPFYNSIQWTRIKNAFKLGYSVLINGERVSNTLCYDCMDKHHRLTPMHSVDHMIAIQDGGSRTDHGNLRSLCLSCHNTKSAIEGNERRKKK